MVLVRLTRDEAEQWLRAAAAGTYALMTPEAGAALMPLFTHLLETLRLRGPRAVRTIVERDFVTWVRWVRRARWPTLAEGARRRILFLWAVRRIMQACP